MDIVFKLVFGLVLLDLIKGGNFFVGECILEGLLSIKDFILGDWDDRDDLGVVNNELGEWFFCNMDKVFFIILWVDVLLFFGLKGNFIIVVDCMLFELRFRDSLFERFR